MHQLHVHFLPALVTPASLSGCTAIVIDALRATSTIITALANGATRVIPCLEVPDAERIAATLPARAVILGGERHGVRIPGFHCGNSPAEYTPEMVRDKTLAFTTTNGTRALQHAKLARRVIIGAAVNVSAVSAGVATDENVHILCAGTDGHVTAEDILVAGLMVRYLVTAESGHLLNDGAQLALLAAGQITSSAELTQYFRTSRGGRNLIDIGLESDIPLCANVDQYRNVPELDIANWEVRSV